MLAEEFFVVKGTGKSSTSKVNAFDKALINAGLGNVNLVPVSSIIPPDAREVKPRKLMEGSIVFTVLSRNDGQGPNTLSAGLVWGWAERENQRLGLVVTSRLNENNEELMKKMLINRINEMAENRGMKLTSYKLETVSLSVPKGYFGSVIVAFIYDKYHLL